MPNLWVQIDIGAFLSSIYASNIATEDIYNGPPHIIPLNKFALLASLLCFYTITNANTFTLNVTPCAGFTECKNPCACLIYKFKLTLVHSFHQCILLK